MKALDRKLVRDLWRMRGQVATIALVVASGIAVFVASLSAYHSLVTSRSDYYATARFADVFSNVKRAPDSLAARIAEIPGVAQLQTRLVFDVLIDFPGSVIPVSGRMIALPTEGLPRINRLHLVSGRTIEANRTDEILVSRGFAEANGLSLGSRISAVLNNRRQTFRIVGSVLSPEYVYATGAGEPLPDDRRFGVFFVAHDVLAHAFAMEGAFNDLAATLAPGAESRAVLAAIDRVLEPYGGLVAYDRSVQPSNRFLSDEIRQQETMAATIPPVFLIVAAFLLHVVMSRLVATQREQIAILKALGYGSELTWHFVKFALAIVGVGAFFGLVFGVVFGQMMMLSYRPFFRFPALIYDLRPWVPAVAAAVSFAAGLAGAMAPLAAVARLRPAEAIRPAAPRPFGSRFLERMVPRLRLPPRWLIAWRGIFSHPVRSLLTVAGLIITVPLLLMSLFWSDALDYMVDVQFAAAERADAVISFVEPQPPRVVAEIGRMPGVLLAEPLRSIAVRLRAGVKTYRTMILGVPPGDQLRRLVDRDLRPIRVPRDGLLLSSRLAEILGVSTGDVIGVDILEGRRLQRDLPVQGLVNDLIGLSAYMDGGALDRLMQQYRWVSGVAVRLDGTQALPFYRAVRATPKINAVNFRGMSIRSFRQSTGAVVLLVASVFTLFAVSIALGVVYNNVRIAFHERAIELATLRILGFTRGEVARMLFAEVGLELLLAIPLGLVAGHWFVRLLLLAFRTEMFEIPAVIAPRSYLIAGLLVAGAGLISLLLVGRQIWRLDLVAVLKTRE